MAATEPPPNDQPAPGRAPEPLTVVVVVGRLVAPDDVPGLCNGLTERLVGRSPCLVVCDVGRVADPDMCVVEAVARLTLTARRLGCGIALRGATADLGRLFAFAGLAGIVPAESGQSSRRGGRPKSGNQRAVSRKNVIPLIRPPDSSRT